MKAQAEPVDLIGIAAVVVVIILIAGVFERDTIFEALKQVAGYTGPAVARDISGMLTIAAAAPGNIIITYSQNAHYSYAVDANGHTVKVIVTGGNVQGAINGEADTVVNLPSISVKNCNQFAINKTGGKYDIQCTQFTSTQ